MAAFTELAEGDAADACEQWQLGRLLEVTPTATGIENSNFFLSSEHDGRRHEWVLTLAERPFEPVVLSTLLRLDATGLPVPVPLRDRHGDLSTTIAGAPALLAPKFPGSHPEQPGLGQIAAIGRFLGRMHRVTGHLDGPEHSRNPAWIEQQAERQRHRLGGQEQHLLATALMALTTGSGRRDWQSLPRGLVHGDVFRDNTLFDGDQLCAVIDFHHTARGPLLFDLAVVANDWCCDAAGRVDADRLRALLVSYSGVRALTREEHWLWPVMTMLAALRFWLARLDTGRKPPAEMARLLDRRLREPFPLEAIEIAAGCPPIVGRP
ncbi:MAG: phosphotransferase [Gammaproteobacteria bacterium]|nr:phosphotransferase [Gammaproteobacteria bacterium]